MSPWDTWIGIIVHRRFKLRWIFKAECYLLFFFWGFFPRGLGKIFSFVMRPAGKINPPWATLEQSFECQTGTLVICPELLGFVSFPFQTPPSWAIPTLSLIHKAQSDSFLLCCFGGGRKQKLHQVPLCFGMIFLNKNLPWISFLLIPGTKQRFSLSFFPFFSSSDVGLWLVLCWSSLSSICGLLEGNINYLTCNDVINSYLARCLLINLGREGPRLTRFPAALAVLLVLYL